MHHSIVVIDELVSHRAANSFFFNCGPISFCVIVISTRIPWGLALILQATLKRLHHHAAYISTTISYCHNEWCDHQNLVSELTNRRKRRLCQRVGHKSPSMLAEDGESVKIEEQTQQEFQTSSILMEVVFGLSFVLF